MAILEGDNSQIDFSDPFYLTEAEFAEFIAILESNYAVVETKQGLNLSRRRLGQGKNVFAKWTPRERSQLLRLDRPIEQVVVDLGRSYMAVDIKRGEMLGEFLPFCESLGRDLSRMSDEEIEAMVVQFLEDRKARRREWRDQQDDEEQDVSSVIEDEELRIDHIPSNREPWTTFQAFAARSPTGDGSEWAARVAQVLATKKPLAGKLSIQQLRLAFVHFCRKADATSRPGAEAVLNELRRLTAYGGGS